MKKFHVGTPDQLQDLEAFMKSGNVEHIRAVWSAKLRKDGKSPWDNSIHVIFSGRSRKANITRSGTDGTMLEIADLKYNPALKWCTKNLKRESEE